MSYGILILAAGEGRRYRQSGGKGDKLLACYPDIHGQRVPLLQLTLNNALSTNLPVMVVCRPEAQSVYRLAEKFEVNITQMASCGSGETIATGVRATMHWSGWLIVPGDMGWLRAEDYQKVVVGLQRGYQQVRLAWKKEPGHPVGFSHHNREALSNLKGDMGARSLLQPNLLITFQASARVVQDADFRI